MVRKYENKYGIRIGFYRAYGEDMGHVTRLARDAVDSLDTGISVFFQGFGLRRAALLASISMYVRYLQAPQQYL